MHSKQYLPKKYFSLTAYNKNSNIYQEIVINNIIYNSIKTDIVKLVSLNCIARGIENENFTEYFYT